MKHDDEWVNLSLSLSFVMRSACLVTSLSLFDHFFSLSDNFPVFNLPLYKTLWWYSVKSVAKSSWSRCILERKWERRNQSTRGFIALIFWRHLTARNVQLTSCERKDSYLLVLLWFRYSYTHALATVSEPERERESALDDGERDEGESGFQYHLLFLISHHSRVERRKKKRER